MKWFLVLCCLSGFAAGAQKVRTMVPGPVFLGNAFQVQYIITDPSNVSGIVPPSFDSMVLVSGPNYYKGNMMIEGRMQSIENITYTLVPSVPGRQKIGGLKVTIKGDGEQTGADVYVNVWAMPEASFSPQSSYTDVNLYAPPSSVDRQKLMDENIFLHTLVDKKTCYVGEPVTAVFKLYSRLQSSSEVVNSPSLYGFSVIDILDFNKSYPAVETINGQVFNTSILRKLQLYPGQSGNLVIDGMDLKNDVEFDDPLNPGHKSRVQKDLSSPSIPLLVKPLPEGKPDDYTGAVGRFGIEASVAETLMSTSATGQLTVTIRGAGNFIQFAPPALSWPAGLDTFDPEISDSLNKQLVPEEGRRRYIFRFTADSAGRYNLPPISFSYFDPAAGRYQTITTGAIAVEVKKPVSRMIAKLTATGSRNYTIALILLLGLLSGGWLLIRYRKKKKVIPTAKTPVHISNTQDEIRALQQIPTPQAGIELEKILRRAEKGNRIRPGCEAELQSILDDCQLLAYSSLDASGKKEELINRASEIVY